MRMCCPPAIHQRRSYVAVPASLPRTTFFRFPQQDRVENQSSTHCIEVLRHPHRACAWHCRAALRAGIGVCGCQIATARFRHRGFALLMSFAFPLFKFPTMLTPTTKVGKELVARNRHCLVFHRGHVRRVGRDQTLVHTFAASTAFIPHEDLLPAAQPYRSPDHRLLQVRQQITAYV